MPKDNCSLPLLPAETKREARAMFNIENLYLAIGDQMDNLLDGICMDYQPDVQEIEDFWNSSLIMLFQYAEDLSDTQAAKASRLRLDWKYALHWPLDHPGIGPLQLCRFRQQLFGHPAALQAQQQLMDRLALLGLFSPAKRPARIEAIIPGVCRVSRLWDLLEAMRLCLEALAGCQPELLLKMAQPSWYVRYQSREQNVHLSGNPTQLQVLSYALAADVAHLMDAIKKTNNHLLVEIPELQILQRLWDQEFSIQESRWFWQPVTCHLCWWLPVEKQEV